MKKIYRYIALAAVTIGFAACSQEEDFAPQQSDIVQIASAYIATEVQTRVNTDGAGDAFENTDEILLVNNTRTDKNKGTYTYSNSAWTLTEGVVLWASGTTVENEFTAYYPASETFELPTDQSTLDGLKSADHMMATATASKGDAVSLGFEHQNAKVTITTSFASQYDKSTTISDLKIGGISPYIVDNAYTAILEPSDNGFTVTLKVNSTDELTATSPSALVAGKHYTFTLSVGKSVATLGEVSVEEWGTTDPLTGGEAIELKATCEISGTTATLTVPELAPEESFTEALETLSAATGVTTITVDGTLTEAQQTALATALEDNTTPEIVFEDMNLADLSDDVKWMGNSMETADGSAILEVASCGENAQCMIYHTGDDNSRTVSIKGTGAITDYIGTLVQPWANQSGYMPNITGVEIAEGITTVGQNAFCQGHYIVSVTLPEGITSLEFNAFNSCISLESIIIPESITSIGNKVFGGCQALESVTVQATTPPTLGTNVFNNCSENLVIYVPAEFLAEYTSKWSDYAEKIQPIP